MTRHVFQHDNGIIDQHTNPDRKTAQCHDIKRQVAQRHDDKGNQNGEWNRQTNDERATYITEKQVDHQHGKQRSSDNGKTRITQRVSNINGLIRHGGDMNVSGNDVLFF